jgi:hypothetical protein
MASATLKPMLPVAACEKCPRASNRCRARVSCRAIVPRHLTVSSSQMPGQDVERLSHQVCVVVGYVRVFQALVASSHKKCTRSHERGNTSRARTLKASSTPPPQVIASMPAPPYTESQPRPPNSRSSPRPPSSLSQPRRPTITSWPAPPLSALSRRSPAAGHCPPRRQRFRSRRFCRARRAHPRWRWRLPARGPPRSAVHSSVSSRPPPPSRVSGPGAAPPTALSRSPSVNVSSPRPP